MVRDPQAEPRPLDPTTASPGSPERTGGTGSLPTGTFSFDALLQQVLDVPDQEREAFLERACDDSTIRAAVMTLLAHEDDLVTFLERQPGFASGDTGRRRDRHQAQRVLQQTRYRIDGELGAGGMGRVYKAFDPLLERHVALKIVHTADPHQSQRLQREARAQASIDHPCVCKVFEVGEVDGEPYVAMQYIDGETLADAARDLTLEQILQLCIQVCEGLLAAHRLGLVHRDVKPSNVMVERTDEHEPRAYVMDFGLARVHDQPDLTRTGATLGTPAYMAPEQIAGQFAPLDRRADIWGLGATLYNLLSGRRVFEDPNPVVVLRKLAEEDPEPLRQVAPSTPRDIDSIVMKCLEKEPARRYASARELAEDLRRFLDGEPIAARPASWTYRLRKKARKHRVVLAIATVAVIGMAAFAGLAARERLRAQVQSEAERRLARDVESIEWIRRASHLLPLHDVRPQRSLARRRMASIQATIDDLGSAARGPGAYALGRSHLALGNVAQARAHLEEAWALGHRTADVAFALGKTLGESYLRQLAEGERLLSDEARIRQRRRLSEELLAPALDFLRLGRTVSTEPSELIEARIALLEGNQEEVIEKTAIARQKVPWLYETYVVESDVHVARALDARGEGAYEAAGAAFDRGQEALLAASRIGASDPQIHTRLCQLQNHRTGLAVWRTGDDATDTYETALTHCRAALTADPDHAEAVSELALVEYYQAEQAFRRGGDAERHIENAQATVARARTLAPDRMATHLASARIGSMHAEILQRRGDDVRPQLEAAIGHLERAIALEPANAYPHHLLGLCLAQLGQHDGSIGLDPVPNMERSRRALRTALEIDPESTNSLMTLGFPLRALAQAEVRRGGDPRPHYDEAIVSIKEAIRREPGLGYAYVNLGAFLHIRGQYALAHGEDPTPHLEEALTTFDAAVERVPDDAFARYNQGHAFTSLARLATHRGEDPTPLIRQGIEAFSRGLELNAAAAGPWASRATLRLIEARWSASRGGDPRSTLEAAGRDIDACLERNPRNATGLRARADLARAHAHLQGAGEGALARGRSALEALLAIDDIDPRNHLALAELELAAAELAGGATTGRAAADRALAAAEAGLAASPRSAEAHLLRGRSLSLLARHTTDPATHTAHLDRAEEAFAQALAINANLRRTIEGHRTSAREP